MVDEIVLEAHENYQKGSYRNRCKISNSYGKYDLSVPLKKGKNEQQGIQMTQISDAHNWELRHWRAIQSAYGRSPFFEHYVDFIEPIFYKTHRYLFDLNLEILEVLRTILQIDVKFTVSETYEKPSPDLQNDFRNIIHPKPHRAGDDYAFYPAQYGQVFEQRHGFIENLSVLDLIFCCGPEARLILRKSIMED